MWGWWLAEIEDAVVGGNGELCVDGGCEVDAVYKDEWLNCLGSICEARYI